MAGLLSLPLLTPCPVGRTGSGKSTLTLALLRCILTEGNVYYDGIPTSSLNLDELRSKITIIPQVVRTLAYDLYRDLRS
jgi:ABC-type multidrug transport system fused ATPase/permease subunit